MNIRKRTLALTFAVVLGTNCLAPIALGADLDLPTLKSSYEQNPTSQETAYNYALALARSGQYTLALDIFTPLSVTTSNTNIIFDHAVVLTWAGDYRAATALYETKIVPMKIAIPAYVQTSIAGVYYQLNDFKAAQLLFHDVAIRGDRQAKRWEAESFMRLNDVIAGNRLYQELLTEDVNDVDTYLSRASMFILLGNNIEANNDIKKALELLPKDQSGNEKRLEVRSEMAVLFIQNGNYSNGIVLLQPTIVDGSATMKMQANYIFALRINLDYKRAISEAIKLWPDLAVVPDFGLQALADCYLRTGQPKLAQKIYQSILNRDNQGTNLDNIKLGLAYTNLKTGNVKIGLALYEELISKNPGIGNTILQDANVLIETGDIVKGKQLYQLLINKSPDNKYYRTSYATVLTSIDRPREAYQQYKILSNIKDAAVTGLAGITNTALDFGDYKAAHAAIELLKKSFATNPVTGQSIQKYQNRSKYSIDTTYQLLKDYKGNDNKEIEFNAREHLEGRFSILGSTSHKKIGDELSYVSLNSYGLGLQYQDVKHEVTLWVDSYNQANNFSGYRFLANHYFDDATYIGIALEKSPVQDAQALSYPIMSTNQTISFNRRLGLKDVYTFSFNTANYSDGNYSSTYGTTFDHTMLDTAKKNISWFSYFNRTNYKYQEFNDSPTPYESPPVRETYGAGVRERWSGIKDYLEATLTAEWGRDRPEAFSFDPSIALEYGYNFTPTKSIIIGTEYALHTDVISSSRHLGFGSRQYYVNYNMTW